MNVTQNVIVLSVSQYCITNEATNQVEVEGTTVRYLLTDDISPFEDKVKSSKGYAPAKVTLSYDNFHKFQAPALYEAVISFSVDSKGSAKITPTEFNFISNISIDKVDSSGAVKSKSK